VVDQEARKLTSREAAKHVGLSNHHLAKMRMTGEGSSFFKLGRKVVYSVGDLDAWLATKRVTETPKADRPHTRRANSAAAPDIAA